MNQYVADLLIISVILLGWAICYGSSRFFISIPDRRVERLENEILMEKPTPVIIRAVVNTDTYYVWGIHFIWLAMLVVFGLGVITDPTVGDDTFEIMGNLGMIAAIPASLTVFFAGLGSTDYGHVVTIMNDNGIRQIRKGWIKFRPYGALSWDEIEEVRMICDQYPRIVLTGNGKTLRVLTDNKNANKLGKMLIERVPSDRFDHASYSECSMRMT